MSLRINSEVPNFVAQTTVGEIDRSCKWIGLSVDPVTRQGEWSKAKAAYPESFKTLQPYLSAVAQPKQALCLD